MQFKVNDSKLKKRISIEKKYFSGSIIETDTNLLREILISIILKVSKYIIKNGIIKIVVRENSNISIDIKVEKPQNEDFVHISPNTLNIFSGLKIRTAAFSIKWVIEFSLQIMEKILSGWSLGDLDSYENFIDQFFPKPFKLEDVITGMSSLLAEKKNPK